MKAIAYLSAACFVLVISLPRSTEATTYCSQLSIDLYTQSDIDNFQTNFGNGGVCDTVGGSLRIGSPGSDIENLHGLSDLVEIGGLHIWSLQLLQGLAGLESLSTIGGDLIISSNDNLSSVEGLQNLAEVGERLILWENPSLPNLNGLANLASAEIIELYRNDQLTSLYGLSNLQTLGSLAIESSQALLSLDGISSLATIESVYLRGNLILSDLGALIHLNTLSTLVIINNDSLENLDGFSNLESVGFLDIQFNEALENVDGLNSIIQANTVRIIGNATLANCRGMVPLLDEIDDATSGPGPGSAGVPDVQGEIFLEDNLEGCNDVESIRSWVTRANIEVGKAFSDGNPASVPIGLSCNWQSAHVFSNLTQASASSPAEFEISRFIPRFAPTCSATEIASPPGYELNGSDCANIALNDEGSYACAIHNAQLPVSLVVSKQYAAPGLDTPPEVRVVVDCPQATAHPSEGQFTIGGTAAFEVTGLPWYGDFCTVTEFVPTGYIQVNADGCVNRSIIPGEGDAIDCTFTNAVDADVLFSSGFENSP